MSLLDHPEAQALLNDAEVSPNTVKSCAHRPIEFLQRYLPKFYRIEQRDNATLVIRGLISGLEAQDLRADRHPVRAAARVRGTPYLIPALWLSRATERDSMLAHQARVILAHRNAQFRESCAM